MRHYIIHKSANNFGGFHNFRVIGDPFKGQLISNLSHTKKRSRCQHMIASCHEWNLHILLYFWKITFIAPLGFLKVGLDYFVHLVNKYYNFNSNKCKLESHFWHQPQKQLYTYIYIGGLPLVWHMTCNMSVLPLRFAPQLHQKHPRVLDKSV